jgi:hypothetical protein
MARGKSIKSRRGRKGAGAFDIDITSLPGYLVCPYMPYLSQNYTVWHISDMLALSHQ